jgi:hypothetical protein
VWVNIFFFVKNWNFMCILFIKDDLFCPTNYQSNGPTCVPLPCSSRIPYRHNHSCSAREDFDDEGNGGMECCYRVMENGVEQCVGQGDCQGDYVKVCGDYQIKLVFFNNNCYNWWLFWIS